MKTNNMENKFFIVLGRTTSSTLADVWSEYEISKKKQPNKNDYVYVTQSRTHIFTTPAVSTNNPEQYKIFCFK